MSKPAFENSVFINCPFDADYAPLLEATLFCVVCFGFSPRLANERLEAGENRLDKIVDMIRGSKYSIHDLSRCKSEKEQEFFRMNMPFEYGMDVGFRRSGKGRMSRKKFLISEARQYELKKSLSDAAGQDVEFHENSHEKIVSKVRDFFRVEAKIAAPGAARMLSDYEAFQGWVVEKKIHEGHTEKAAVSLPTRERLDEMLAWIGQGKPLVFRPVGETKV